jgi:hypothetical protein
MEEKRRYPRYSVSWPVRLWLSNKLCVEGRAVDASAHGLLVTLYETPDRVKLSEMYPLEIHPGTRIELACTGEIRHIGSRGIGLEINGGLRGGTKRLRKDLHVTAAQALSRLAAIVSGSLPSLSEVTRPSIGDRLADLAVTALHQAVEGNVSGVRRTLGELRTLVRFVVRFDELSTEESLAIRDMTALGSILIVDDQAWIRGLSLRRKHRGSPRSDS